MWPQLYQPFMIHRPAAQTFDAAGYPEAKVFTDSDARGSIQPLGKDVVILDPGFSAADARMLFSFSEIRSANETTGTPCDEATFGGTRYRVWQVNSWPSLGPIAAHWEAVVSLIQPIVPVTP